jgi:hypothetical protein
MPALGIFATVFYITCPIISRTILDVVAIPTVLTQIPLLVRIKDNPFLYLYVLYDCVYQSANSLMFPFTAEVGL